MLVLLFEVEVTVVSVEVLAIAVAVMGGDCREPLKNMIFKL